MALYNSIYALDFLNKFIFLLMSFSTFFLSILFFFNTNLKKKNSVGSNFFIQNINYVLVTLMLTFAVYFMLLFYLYIRTLNSFLYFFNFNNFFYDKSFNTFFIFNVQFALDIYSYILIILAFFVGFFSLLASDSRIKNLNTNFFFYFHYFLVIVYFFVSVEDIVTIFIFYELLLIPSFLFIYFVSYTRKAMQASLYFVIWTQVGSILVFISILYIINLTGSSSFSSVRTFLFKSNEVYLIFSLFFLGFGFKIPIWPFHYWLTKTHVEASSGFSIYLSGFLVKSALFAFFKLTNLLSFELETVFFSVIAFIGSIDASLKMWGQSDIKKLVAYCTVQEMNLMLLIFLLGDSSSTICGIIFSAAHAFLSAFMFYLVDCIYRRFHTRTIYSIQGLLQLTPNIGIFVIIMCVIYAGLPGTIKFSCEFFIFSTLMESSWLSCIFLMFVVNVLGLIGFSKVWFTTIFGLPNKSMNNLVLDLSWKEIYILMYVLFFFFLFNYTYLLAF